MSESQNRDEASPNWWESDYEDDFESGDLASHTPSSGNSKTCEESQLHDKHADLKSLEASDYERLTQEFEDMKERMGYLMAQNGRLERAVETMHESGCPQFNPHDLGFFDHNHVDKNIEQGYFLLEINSVVFSKDGRDQYRNVESFIDAAENIMQQMSADVLRSNLHKCLIGEAHTWYHSTLTDSQRQSTREGEGLTNWIKLLHARWGYTIKNALRDLEILSFKDYDLEFGFITGFMLQAKRIARRLGMDTAFAQLCLAYSHFQPKLRQQIPPPTEDESIDDFIRRVDAMRSK
ncbi:hypothetical protein HDK90DRAFT_556805 [Phyllosticta capitalensis]|uniref:Uncharacterized protein n=1 Tax=Phyllosticta capitalensis TaxID=121624 RepID=A0ABR1YJF2_9PEZI